MREFNPQRFIFEYLAKLRPREQQILENRYGLGDGQVLTLEALGKRLNLTRERVRQIEKEAFLKLANLPLPPDFEQGVDLIFKIIEEHGNILREDLILDTFLAANNTPVGRMSILFILKVAERFNLFRETSEFYQSWYVLGFEVEFFKKIISTTLQILASEGRPLDKTDLFETIRKQTLPVVEASNLGDAALESYLLVSKRIDRNAYGQWGLVTWPEISPGQVGDKAYLVLLHNNKQPEHYVRITELINKQQFDERTAHPETVHNELIKDKRFVLVGRGIYALQQWGYEPGTVASVIEQILRTSQRPLTRDEIIEQVLKHRLVKRNTIIVGLSNRKRFRRTEDNRYTNV